MVVSARMRTCIETEAIGRDLKIDPASILAMMLPPPPHIKVKSIGFDNEYYLIEDIFYRIMEIIIFKSQNLIFIENW